MVSGRSRECALAGWEAGASGLGTGAAAQFGGGWRGDRELGGEARRQCSGGGGVVAAAAAAAREEARRRRKLEF